MRIQLSFLTLLLCLCISGISRGQATAPYAIQLEAQVQTAPAEVLLSWKKISGASSYTVFRKAKEATSWGAVLATTVDSFYKDNSISGDSSYEYKVLSSGASTNAYGHILVGINAPALHYKGSILLVVDTLFRDSCVAALQQYMNDLRGDGWRVLRIDVNRSEKDIDIKNKIKTYYSSLGDLKALQLIGHVAVPYSGNLNPDAHPNHLGAWPADVFYADMDGIWTDVSVNSTAASRSENQNILGDGKWDQTYLPTRLELQVARIDFYDMPLFTTTEVNLMKSYFSKAHTYKTDSLYVSKKAIVDDNFGAFSGEAFAANAYRNFTQMVGRENVFAGDFMTSLHDSAYQWAYGCGGGSYTSCSGVGTTTDFSSKNQKGIFTMLFGSYFGDWDNKNNFLRAPLCCNEPALACMWAGRPNWFVHAMGLGENIGYSTLQSMNYTGSTYIPPGYMAAGVHVALMGDLSLRTQYIQPASDIHVSSVAKKGANISWTASPDPELTGYYVYRSYEAYGQYEKISPLLTSTSFTDTLGTDTLYYYMVRPCVLEETPSGTYYNLGLGIVDSASISFPEPSAIHQSLFAGNQFICFPNPAGNTLNLYTHWSKAGVNVHVSLYDIKGRLVYTRYYPNTSKECTLSENISALSPGTYFIQLKTGIQILYTSQFNKL